MKTKNKIIIYILGGFLIFLQFSCSNDSVCKIKHINERVDTSNIGLGVFQFYTSDTCWHEMSRVGDSLSKKYKKKAYVIAIFSYPEKNIPSFNEGEFYINTEGVDLSKNFDVARYYDTSKVFPPVLETTPWRYIKAKELESKGEL